MHIVHLPANGKYADSQLKTADEIEATGIAGYAVYGMWFEKLDCEAIEDDDDAAAACFEKRQPSDNFFESLEICDDLYNGFMDFSEEVADVPVQAFIDSLIHEQFYSYDGGLTTPPCTEGVRWTMLKNPVPISDASIACIMGRTGESNPEWAPDCVDCSKGNNRVTMPVGDRTIYYNDGDVYAGAI